MTNLLAASQSNLSPGYQTAALFIPVAAAVITGVVALMNARTHPTVKLKTLIDASKELPPSIHAKYAMERIILREMGRLDLVTSGWYLRGTRLMFSAMIVIVVGLLVFDHSALSHAHPNLASWVRVGANLLTLSVFTVSVGYLHPKVNKHWEPYDTRLDALKTMEDREIAEAQAIKDAASKGDNEPVSEDAGDQQPNEESSQSADDD
jgi:hypothetical protein